MSALYRLKAYFGMVPVDDFDPADFDPADLDPAQVGSAEFSDHYPGYRSCDDAAHQPSSRRSHRGAFDGDDGGFAAQGGRPTAVRTHATRPPSWVTESWATKTPVRGSLAIDTASAARQSMSHRPLSHRPAAAPSSPSMPSTSSIADEPLVHDGAHPLARIVTLHPHNYNEARPIGERYREGNPVIMNLTEMQDRDAKRLVDFAAGLAFALRGSIDKITNKVFLLSPPDVDVSPEDRRLLAEGRLFD